MGGISYDNKNFYINGKPEKIVSGAIHYFRVVPEYWYDRLLKLKECGCNCVETYICWNLHEKKQGEFDFSGWLDFGKYLDIAYELGLYAIVRPGPYICSEWDFGGLPWWILKFPEVETRCSNEMFLKLCTPYLEKVCEIIGPRLITNEGNIIFVQIENEYGTYGNDKMYMNWIKNFYLERDINCGLLTSDGGSDHFFVGGTVEGVLASVNYRCDSVAAIGALKKFRKDQPGAALELWNGRAMHWGEKFERRDVDEVKESVRSALEHTELLNLYMFHGGTTFGFMNGADDRNNQLIVQMTSYDVDAPLDEYGRRTPKYYAEQEEICKARGIEIKNTATDTRIVEYDTLTYVGECSLKESELPIKTHFSLVPKSMEYFNQGYGYIVYETEFFVEEGVGGYVTLPEVHDIANVYVDGEYMKTFMKYEKNKYVRVEKGGYHHLSILVENMGRICSGVRLKNPKGILEPVNISSGEEYDEGKMGFDYKIHSLTLDVLPKVYIGCAKENQPAFYKYTLDVEEVMDTVINIEGFTRGVVFFNGINLGRHWNIENSENKLFVPAPFIKKGENEIVVFDVLHTNNEKKITFGEKTKI